MNLDLSQATAAVAGAASASMVKADPGSPVEQAADTLRASQYETAALVSSLADRLSMVLSPVPPAPAGADSASKPQLVPNHSPLMSELTEGIARQAMLNTALSDLIHRLQVS